jgi:hypothetical protein
VWWAIERSVRMGLICKATEVNLTVKVGFETADEVADSTADDAEDETSETTSWTSSTTSARAATAANATTAIDVNRIVSRRCYAQGLSKQVSMEKRIEVEENESLLRCQRK